MRGQAFLTGQAFLAMWLFLLFSVFGSPVQAQSNPLKIEQSRLLPPGDGVVDLGVALESNRTLQEQPGRDREYDNVRFHPVQIRYGDYTEILNLGRFEWRLGASYSSNDGDRSGDPDETGLESVTAGLKTALTRYVSLSLDVSALGDEDVAPYGNDGVDASINLPFRVPTRTGEFYGELGYVLKSGQFQDDADFENYPRYGVGYAFLQHPLDFPPLNLELVGHGNTIEDAEDHLELLLGTHYTLRRSTLLSPWGGVGLEEGSPEYSVGLRIRHRF